MGSKNRYFGRMMALDKFSMTPEKMVYVAGGPDRGVCWVQFSRTVQFEVVRESKI